MSTKTEIFSTLQTMQEAMKEDVSALETLSNSVKIPIQCNISHAFEMRVLDVFPILHLINYSIPYYNHSMVTLSESIERLIENKQTALRQFLHFDSLNKNVLKLRSQRLPNLHYWFENSGIPREAFNMTKEQANGLIVYEIDPEHLEAVEAIIYHENENTEKVLDAIEQGTLDIEDVRHAIESKSKHINVSGHLFHWSEHIFEGHGYSPFKQPNWTVILREIKKLLK